MDVPCSVPTLGSAAVPEGRRGQPEDPLLLRGEVVDLQVLPSRPVGQPEVVLKPLRLLPGFVLREEPLTDELVELAHVRDEKGLPN